MKSLLVLVASLSVALGAICNGKGLCMSLEVSQDDHFKMRCSFDSNGRTAPVEWQVSNSYLLGPVAMCMTRQSA